MDQFLTRLCHTSRLDSRKYLILTLISCLFKSSKQKLILSCLLSLPHTQLTRIFSLLISFFRWESSLGASHPELLDLIFSASIIRAARWETIIWTSRNASESRRRRWWWWWWWGWSVYQCIVSAPGSDGQYYQERRSVHTFLSNISQQAENQQRRQLQREDQEPAHTWWVTFHLWSSDQNIFIIVWRQYALIISSHLHWTLSAVTLKAIRG